MKDLLLKFEVRSALAKMKRDKAVRCDYNRGIDSHKSLGNV